MQTKYFLKEQEWLNCIRKTFQQRNSQDEMDSKVHFPHTVEEK